MKLQTQKRIYQRHLILVMATDVVWPIIVLKAKLVIVAIETPLARVLVSKISAGIIQESGPQAQEKEKLYSQVIAIKPHEAP